jgi:DMSO/TMAO reductase YedYZ molybdopterin-dependent catalytic subunit
MTTPRRLDRLPVFPVPEGPSRPDAAWLRIGGLVERERTLGREEILALPAVDLNADFGCEEGWTVPGLRWTGVRVADPLAKVGPAPEARFVAVGAGDFISVLPLATFDEHGDEQGPLLAYLLDGEPLPPEHGGPLRLIAGWTACYQSVKWVDRLVLTADEVLETARPIALARIDRRETGTRS